MITRHVDRTALIADLLSDVWLRKMCALSKAITLIENNPDGAKEILDRLDPAVKPRDDKTRVIPRLDRGIQSDDTELNTPHVVGLTGLPGAGKSTLANFLIKTWRAQNKTVAVLAIDPSSSSTGGAVLGDRIRMQEHFKDDGVFIRSMGARGALGGLSQATHAVLKLLKWIGFDKILVETVGVGQSESEIMKEADTVVLVLLPHTGDEIQFMKAGITQLAHIYAINKSDLGDAFRIVQELEDFEPRSDGWKAPVICTSAVDNRGIDILIAQIEHHHEMLKQRKENS